MRRVYFILSASMVLGALLYLSGCGDDKSPAVNNAPEFEEVAYEFEIAENAASGSEVGVVSATDENGDDLTYMLSGTGSDPFAITDGTEVPSGQEVSITVAAGADLPSLAADPITVRVTDGTDSTDVNMVVIVNVAPVFEQADYAFEIAEDVAAGAQVGTVSATDSNGDMLIYALSGTEAGQFEISNVPVASGEAVPIIVAADADLPALASPVTVIVSVTDRGKSALTATVEVQITITEVTKPTPDNTPPLFANTPYAFEIAEDATAGDVVGTVSATDPDAGARLTYTLSGTHAANFEISNAAVPSDQSVPILVATDADLSSLGGSVTIVATVNDGSSMATEDVMITILAAGVNAAPVFGQTDYAFEIAEDATAGDVVGTISATDPNGDRLTYTLDGSGAGPFEITNGTDVPAGEPVTVVVATGADLSSLGGSVATVATATDAGALTATAHVVTTILPAGTNAAPVFGQTDYAFEIAEDATAGDIVGVVAATDPNGDRLTYTLDGSGAGPFEITNGTDVPAGEAVPVVVATSADLSSLGGSVTAVVTATDGGTLTATANVAITILAAGVNVPPVFGQTDYAFEIMEGAVGGDVVGRVSATDSNIDSRLSYTLTGPGSVEFAISGGTLVASGVEVPITIASNALPLDFESGIVAYALQVYADDGVEQATANVTVSVLDVNDEAPLFEQGAYSFGIIENVPGSTVVGSISATDADAGDRLTYTLSGTGADRFAISGTPVPSGTPVTIAVAPTATLDHEDAASYTLQAMVADEGRLSAIVQVAISVSDINERPVFATTDYSFGINEDAANTEGVGTVSATDVDEGNLLTYTLSGTGADNFVMDSTPMPSGTPVTIAVAPTAALDHETAESYTLQAMVSDQDGLNATAQVVIDIGNVNEFEPMFDSDSYSFDVVSDATDGAVVGMIAATDMDSDAMIAYTISGAGASDFAIDGTPVASGTPVPITVGAGTQLFPLVSPVIVATASDGSRTSNVTVAINIRRDYDQDDNGLIDIRTLEQLNAIRYDLDGNGEVDAATDADAYDAAFPGAIAYPTAPTGYELLNNLDFDNATSYADAATNMNTWTTGKGWQPIGEYISVTNIVAYTADFDGNHRTISNLFINRATGEGDDGIGLFVRLSTGTVSGLGLVDVDVAGDVFVASLASSVGGGSTLTTCYVTGNVTGHSGTGGLVGEMMSATLTACYATCTVTGSIQTGGLVGYVPSGATITACYMTGNVLGSIDVGGLIGELGGNTGLSIIESEVTACYATGDVTGISHIGGLIGDIDINRGTVTACYARGDVTHSLGADPDIGGLIGQLDGLVTASYYDSTTSGQRDNDGRGIPVATTVLQSPIDYDTDIDDTNDSSIYETWNVDINGDSDTDDPWDFGTTMQYPVLKVDFNGDGVSSSAEFGTQR